MIPKLDETFVCSCKNKEKWYQNLKSFTTNMQLSETKPSLSVPVRGQNYHAFYIWRFICDKIWKTIHQFYLVCHLWNFPKNIGIVMGHVHCQYIFSKSVKIKYWMSLINICSTFIMDMCYKSSTKSRTYSAILVEKYLRFSTKWIDSSVWWKYINFENYDINLKLYLKIYHI